MRKKKVFLLTLIFMLCSFLIWPVNTTLPVFQTTEENAPAIKDEQADEVFHSGPADQKEKVGVLISLGWVWLSIFVLLYFLRQKIIETDRLFESGYYTSGGEKECHLE